MGSPVALDVWEELEELLTEMELATLVDDTVIELEVDEAVLIVEEPEPVLFPPDNEYISKRFPAPQYS